MHSIKSTEGTKLDVLGQSSQWVEYQPETDASCRFEQKEDGLHVSVVRAQRLYNNHKWPNPIVLKLTNVESALVPPKLETLSADVINGSITFKGKLLDMGKAGEVKVGYEFRPYAGFVEELYNDKWIETDFQSVNKPEEFSAKITDLKKGQTYQVRAVVKHPLITIYGDIKRFTF